MRVRAAVSAGLCALALAAAASAPAQQPASGYAIEDADWRFNQHRRRVKVVLLAGSIGAYRDMPYGRLLYEWCENVEVKNLSRVGQGAPQLLQRFRDEVVENPNVPIGARGVELWLLFGGGLNSVGVPERTNLAIRDLFHLAHRRRFGVVAFTLSPWGSFEDDERWSGVRALDTHRATRSVVDFVRGRLDPIGALGRHRVERRDVPDPDAPWLESERPDVVVDLYDSPLRNRDVPPLPIEVAREVLERDPRWRRRVDALSAAERAARLEADAADLATAPQYFLRPEYRAFDHIHPNREGHRVIAQTACPSLPRTWGCRCP